MVSGRFRGDASRLPVFWIAGRSGTGKSVALLHLLASLHRTDDERVIVWLDQRADLLADAVRWARPFFAQFKSVIFASDDPYTPERYQRVSVAIDDALRELDSISVAYPNFIRPNLIFCGPTEQSQNFEDDLVDRILFEKFLVPEESKGDIEELRQWYTQRTGRTVFPIGFTDNALIVQLFFEWTTGEPIREFAARFRRRLEGMVPEGATRTVFDLVSEILALNRIYALFPAQALVSELERDADIGASFDRLRNAERHFSFEAERGGYRLTHPHLANALYVAWFGRPDDRRHRKTHLLAGINAALADGESVSRRFAPLWAIARLKSDRHPQSADSLQRLNLVAEELRELLTELYHRFSQSPAPLAELPVWTDLDQQLGLQLRPSPIELLVSAVRSVESPVPGLRLACHKLLQHRFESSSGSEVVAGILNKFPSWHEWPHLAIDYAKSADIASIEYSLCEHVAQKATRPTTLTLTSICFGVGNRDVGRRVILRWLGAVPISNGAWPAVFTKFIDRFNFCDASQMLSWRFLQSQKDHPSWSHVWERLHASLADQTESTIIARSWLGEAKADISGWSHVWEKLWEVPGERDDALRVLGRKWLEEAPAEHGSWAFVWEELWQASGKSDTALLALGRKWLEEAPAEHGSWAFIWGELWQASGKSDAALLALGRKWLEEAPAEHGSWKYVWEELWQASGKSDAALLALGRKWLEEAPAEHGSWAFIWDEFWQASGKSDTALLALGRKWLEEAPAEHGSWKYVWEELWQASGKSDAALLALGRKWLEEAPAEHGSWKYVWEELWQASGKSDSALLALGRKWLEEAPAEHGSWAFVWGELWQASGKSDAALLALSRKWLEEAPAEHGSWKYVWEELWQASGKSDSALLALGRKWLEEAPAEHGSWKYVWEELWQASGKSDSALLALGRKWLEEAPAQHRSWCHMWRALWRASGSVTGLRTELTSFAVRWLEDEKIANPAWPVIWNILWDERGLERNMLARNAARLIVRAPPKDQQPINTRLAHVGTPSLLG